MNRELREVEQTAAKAREWTERRDEAIRRASESGQTRRAVATAAGIALGKVQKIVSRTTVLALVLLLVPVVATDARAAKSVVLGFHAGGFVKGSPALLDQAMRVAERRGAKVENVAYTLGDPNRAVRDAIRAAKRYSKRRTVYAYGESAGGALAARLAQRGLVDRAAAYSPLADIATWRDGYFAGSARAQVLGRNSRVPVLALVAAEDEPLFVRAIRRWARSDRRVKLRTVAGTHLGEDGAYRQNMRGAMRWLMRRGS